ncbi:MAG: hypothetical protein NTY61_00455 [Candidatus Parcubacteria bacterium]|nr:hypothetical protein [Candidatus Parcubacteria bacterium]
MYENIWYIRCRGCKAKGRIEAPTKDAAIAQAKEAHCHGRLYSIDDKECSAGPEGDMVAINPKYVWIVVTGRTGKAPGVPRTYEGFFKAAFDEFDWAVEFAESYMGFFGRHRWLDKPTERRSDSDEGGNTTVIGLEWESVDPIHDDGYMAVRHILMNPLDFEH